MDDGGGALQSPAKETCFEGRPEGELLSEEPLRRIDLAGPLRGTSSVSMNLPRPEGGLRCPACCCSAGTAAGVRSSLGELLDTTESRGAVAAGSEGVRTTDGTPLLGRRGGRRGVLRADGGCS
mmetsp:Transcript_28154/g.77540  ORF Transcript_28154/g.77540 Transcript_28154/m.77540 type:complete len:123 (+) Transcript_28154:515-883(+)